MKDYNITLKVRNNWLLSAMRDSRIYTVADLYRATGITQSTLGEYLNLKALPIHKKTGEWKETVLKIAAVLGRMPEELFPPQHIEKALPINRGELSASREEMQWLADNAPAQRNPELLMEKKEALERLDAFLWLKLTDRERTAVLMRAKGATWAEIGRDVGRDPTGKGGRADKNNVSTERARQLHCKAIRKLQRAANYNDSAGGMGILTDAFDAVKRDDGGSL